MQQVPGTNKHILTAKEIVSLVDKKIIYDDPQNRGGKGINKAKVLKLAHNINYNALGMLSFSKKGSKLQIVTGHHRVHALCVASKSDKLKPNELIMVQIVESNESTDLYTLDAVATGHSAQDKFSTLRYAQAKDIENFANINNISIPRNKRVVVGSLFFALMENSVKKGEITYNYVYNIARKEATKRSTNVEPKPFYNLDTKTIQELVEGFRYYESIIKQIRTLAPDKKLVKQLQKPGFLGLILTDYVCKSHGIVTNFKSIKKLSEMIVKNQNIISLGLKELTHNSEVGITQVRKGLGLK
jgi:hypothetical protein